MLRLCQAFIDESHQPLAAADALVGRAGRVAYVLDKTRPFVASLYRALACSLRAQGAKAREAPPARVACRRFKYGVRMLKRILSFDDQRAPVPHSRDILADALPAPDPAVRRVEIDASPWGAGGVLFEDGRPVQYFACRWRAADFKHLDVCVGSCASQTFFEVLALVLAVEAWGHSVRPLTILGDNVAALQEALSLRGRGLHEPLSQALAVLTVARSLPDSSVGHLPTESNLTADALSRLFEPDCAYSNPFEGRNDVKRVRVVRPRAIWDWIR